MNDKIQRIDLSGEAELREFLSQFSQNETVLLGQESEVKNFFCAFIVLNSISPIRVVGLITEGHGIVPECYCVEDILVVGYNHQICVIQEKTSTQIAANSLFYTFLSVENKSSIIALFELDVVCFSSKGKKNWEYCAPDIITNCYFESEYLVIQTDCGEQRIAKRQRDGSFAAAGPRGRLMRKNEHRGRFLVTQGTVPCVRTKKGT